MARDPVLLTRPLDDSRRIADMLEPDGIDCLIWPLTKVQPVQPEAPLPVRIEALLITSAHGIRAFARLSSKRECPVFCVGARTAQVARSLGFPFVMSAEGDGAALVRLARNSGQQRFFYPRGREAAIDMAAILGETGHRVEEAVLYETVPTGPPPAPVAAALAALAAGRLGAVTIWSARNAALLAEHLTASDSRATACRTVPLIAISAASAAPLRASFDRIEVATAPNAGEMLRLIRAVQG